MKKYVIILCCLFGSLAFASAQETEDYNWQDNPSSLSITIGAPSLVTVIESTFDNIMERNNYTSSFSGSASIRYDYNVLRWMAVGGRFSYDGWKIANNDPENTNIKNESGHHSSVLMEILFTYINREHVQLYSGVALGMQYYVHSEDALFEKGIMAAGSVIPIGVHVGGKRVYGLAEVSLGTEAMMSFGVGVHF